jgi:hypothetical protein
MKNKLIKFSTGLELNKRGTVMKKSTFSIIILCVFLVALVSQTLAQPNPTELTDRRKLGQTGMQFLSVTVDARAAALGGAMATQQGSSSNLFYNPAGISEFDGFADISISQNKWIADINYNQAAAIFNPFGGQYGTVGVSFLAVDYGDIEETIRFDNEAGYLNTGTNISPSALALGLAYGRSLTNMFSVGTQVKFIGQDLGQNLMTRTVDSLGTVTTEFQDNTLDAVAVDFGIQYKTGFKSLVFAMNVRNFSKDYVYEREEFQLPLNFQVGVAMDIMDLTSMDKEVHSLLLAVDASHPRSYDEQLMIGAEYTLVNMLSLRGGYRFPLDEDEITFGLGLNTKLGGMGFGVDYAYSDFGLFGEIQRVSAHFSF